MVPRKHRAATRADHRKFCETEQWRLESTSHHETFSFVLPDGRKLRTRISRPVGRETYGRSIFAHILRDQLECTEDEFFACVDGGQVPRRIPEQPEYASALELRLAMQLKTLVGLTDADIARLDTAQAHTILAEYFTPKPDS